MKASFREEIDFLKTRQYTKWARIAVSANINYYYIYKMFTNERKRIVSYLKCQKFKVSHNYKLTVLTVTNF